MNTRVETDIIGMLSHLVCALQAFAKAQDVNLSFESDNEELIISHNPQEIINVVTKLICQVIEYAPPKQSVLLKPALLQEQEGKTLKIFLCVTGINLSRVNEITKDFKHQVIVEGDKKGGTIYELQWQLEKQESSSIQSNDNIHKVLPGFYAKVRGYLQSYFTKSDNLIAFLSTHHPKDAIFLKKVNALILSNIDKDGFNANHLSDAMMMSRAQLYRRLYPIIREAPAHYIKKMRLQRAKELLETTDMRIGEVAFKTGFQTCSHFTRVFSKYYGVSPSLFCRKTKM